jgi:hypothetical protein
MTEIMTYPSALRRGMCHSWGVILSREDGEGSPPHGLEILRPRFAGLRMTRRYSAASFILVDDFSFDDVVL